MNIKELKKNTNRRGWGVYRHIRLDKNEPFYIGIFKDQNRPYSKKYRNKAWKGVIEKSDYEVEILFEGLTKKQAIEKEIEFIKLYGRIDIKTGCLYNMTDGGEGANNTCYTKERNKKISNTLKGVKFSEERKLACCLGQKNRKKVIAEGKIFDSIRQCAKYYNINKRTVVLRCHSDNFDFNFV